jgi:hypothetical protein
MLQDVNYKSIKRDFFLLITIRIHLVYGMHYQILISLKTKQSKAPSLLLYPKGSQIYFKHITLKMNSHQTMPLAYLRLQPCTIMLGLDDAF